MSRLFIALGLPNDVTSSLAKVAPQPELGVRVVPTHQMHITLHFLGEANPAAALEALQTIDHPRFQVNIGQLGTFHGRNDSTILWAGVESAGLRSLHKMVSDALSSGGYDIEESQFRPHVTLARCRSGHRDAAKRYLPHPVKATAFTATELLLFKSEFRNGSPIYSVLGRVALARPSTPKGS